MVSWTSALLAALPILCACALMAAGIKSHFAAIAALATAVVVSVTAFPISAQSAADITASLGPVLIEVLFIVLGGVLLGGLLQASGAQATITGWIETACSTPQRAVLLVVLGITPFAESVTGFGLGVIVGIPILRHFGLSPTRSAILGLMGLVVGPWGSLGPGMLVAAELGNVGFGDLGFWSALFVLPVLVVMSVTALIIGFGVRRALPYLPHALTLCALMWGILIAFNYFVSPPLAGAAASLVSIAATLLIARLRDGSGAAFRGPIRRAVLPYALLMGALLAASLLVEAFDAGGPAQYAASPALWLLLACAATPALVGMRTGQILQVLREGIVAAWTIGFSTAAFLLLGGLLAASGMSDTLAAFAAQLGPAYLAVVPLVGAIGAFITGSNTGAASMFSTSTVQAAHELQSRPLVALAGQNVAASAAFMASPPKVALAIAAAAGPASEGTVRFGAVFRPVLLANVLVVVVLAALTMTLA